MQYALKGLRGFMWFYEQRAAIWEGDDGVCVSVRGDGDVDVFAGHDGAEVCGVPVFSCWEVFGAVLYDEGAVLGDVAHELEGGGGVSEGGDCGGVEVVVGCY